MFAGLQAWRSWPARAASTGLAALATILLLAGCSGSLPDLAAPSGAPSQPAAHIGEGAVKVALIVPLAASGNAGVAAQSMRNAAEMALAEFNNPDLQLLVKDDAGVCRARSRRRSRRSMKERRSSWGRCLRSRSLRLHAPHALAACR